MFAHAKLQRSLCVNLLIVCITVCVNDEHLKWEEIHITKYVCFLFLNREGHGKISVFAVKMALATLCGGKIMDKLRCKSSGWYFLPVNHCFIWRYSSTGREKEELG